MKKAVIRPARGISGKVNIPPDKSISHRAAIFASLGRGRSVISNFLFAEDCVNTVKALRQLGVKAEVSGRDLIVEGRGLKGLSAPEEELYFGNSGTGMRLMAGVLAGQSFSSVLTGDESLSRRPMERITIPLGKMGADIAPSEGGTPPINIRPGNIKGADYESPVASAQVKSCLLLAGLYSGDTTSVTEPFRSRDHTERMMRHLGIPVKVEGRKVSVTGGAEWDARDIQVPGDLSSAAFFAAACALFPGRSIYMPGVNRNPTRDGFLRVLARMGCKINWENLRFVCGEEQGDLSVTGSELRAVTLGPDEVPAIIDELPLLALLATQSEGVSRITGAGELRKKETDRLSAVAAELKKMGQELREGPDWLEVTGNPGGLKGASVRSYGDHRMAMMLAVAGLKAEGETLIDDVSCIDTSFPGFLELLEGLVER